MKLLDINRNCFIIENKIRRGQLDAYGPLLLRNTARPMVNAQHHRLLAIGTKEFPMDHLLLEISDNIRWCPYTRPRSHAEGVRFVIQRSDVTKSCSTTLLTEKLKLLE